MAAERGHDVTLYEADGQLGGQLALATKAAWREPLSGIARYQELQLRKLGADIRLGVEATAETVEAEAPDVVIAATGARASKGDFIGDDLAVTAWDVLEGRVALAESALVYDDGLNYTGATAAAFMAERGTAVELATPDRLVSEDVGKTDRPAFMRHFHSHGVVMTPDLRLVSLAREGNKLLAVLANEYTDGEEERLVDQVVADNGTIACDALYFALKPHARNLGELDQPAFVAGRPQGIVSNPDGRFRLFRIGDALAGRNVHAAVYDGLRIAKDL